jgi:hypothetical protein
MYQFCKFGVSTEMYLFIVFPNNQFVMTMYIAFNFLHYPLWLNTTTTETLAGQSTNTTGVSSGTGEYDDGGEVEEGQGEDQGEPGDVDTGDKEDYNIN